MITQYFLPSHLTEMNSPSARSPPPVTPGPPGGPPGSICPSLTSLFSQQGTRGAELCQGCGGAVYHAERVGPVNGVVFHRQCFLCCVCRQHLTLRTYFTNQVELTDKGIYCNGHCPRYYFKIWSKFKVTTNYQLSAERRTVH